MAQLTINNMLRAGSLEESMLVLFLKSHSNERIVFRHEHPSEERPGDGDSCFGQDQKRSGERETCLGKHVLNMFGYSLDK